MYEQVWIADMWHAYILANDGNIAEDEKMALSTPGLYLYPVVWEWLSVGLSYTIISWSLCQECKSLTDYITYLLLHNRLLQNIET